MSKDFNGHIAKSVLEESLFESVDSKTPDYIK